MLVDIKLAAALGLADMDPVGGAVARSSRSSGRGRRSAARLLVAPHRPHLHLAQRDPVRAHSPSYRTNEAGLSTPQPSPFVNRSSLVNIEKPCLTFMADGYEMKDHFALSRSVPRKGPDRDLRALAGCCPASRRLAFPQHGSALRSAVTCLERHGGNPFDDRLPRRSREGAAGMDIPARGDRHRDRRFGRALGRGLGAPQSVLWIPHSCNDGLAWGMAGREPPHGRLHDRLAGRGDRHRQHRQQRDDGTARWGPRALGSALVMPHGADRSWRCGGALLQPRLTSPKWRPGHRRVPFPAAKSSSAVAIS